MTLIEVLAAVGIVLVLFSLLVVSGRAIQNSTRRGRAQAQLQLLAAAMDRYVRAWPAWPGAPNQNAAVRGWPNWSGWALFPTAVGYNTVANYNDAPMRQRDLSNDDAVNAGGQFTGRADLRGSNETLGYALTAHNGGGPFIREADVDFHLSDPPALYPGLAGATPDQRRGLVDAWGTPYRYFWVMRDADATNPSGWRAITSADSTDPNDPANDPFYARADGFVLESAGPDKKFGNIWKRSPTADEKANAEDNVVIKP